MRLCPVVWAHWSVGGAGETHVVSVISACTGISPEVQGLLGGRQEAEK